MARSLINPPLAHYAVDTLLQGLRAALKKFPDKSTTPVRSCDAQASLALWFYLPPDLGFGNPRIYGTLSGGIVALVAYVVVEARSDHPMMPLHLFVAHLQRHQPVNSVPVRSTEREHLLIAEPSAGAAGLQSLAGLADIPFALLLTGLSGWRGYRHGLRLLLIIGPSPIGLGFLDGLCRSHGPSDYWTTFLLVS